MGQGVYITAVDDHADEPPEPPVAQIVDLPVHRAGGGVAGSDPAPHRDAFAGDGQPNHDLQQIGPAVLGVTVAA